MSLTSKEIIRKVNRKIVWAKELNFRLYQDIYRNFLWIPNKRLSSYLLSELRNTIRSSGIDRSNFTQVKFFAETKAQEVIDKIDVVKERNSSLKQMVISDEDRARLSEFGIKKLRSWLWYRWWVARIIAMILLWHSPSPVQLETISDADMVVIDNWTNTHKDIIEEFNADSNGIKYVKSFHTENQTMQVDLSMNQVFVTENWLYYSDWFLRYLNEDVCYLTDSGIDMYGIKSYIRNGQEVFHPSRIERAFKFLIEWKVAWIELPRFYLNKANLDKLWFRRPLVTLVRRCMTKQFNEQATEKRLSFLRNLASLLIKIGYIEKEEELFTFLLQIKKETKMSTENRESSFDTTFDAKWKLEKLINTHMTKFTGYTSKSKKVISWLNLSDTDLTTLTLPEKKEPSSSFIESYKKRKYSRSLSKLKRKEKNENTKQSQLFDELCLYIWKEVKRKKSTIYSEITDYLLQLPGRKRERKKVFRKRTATQIHLDRFVTWCTDLALLALEIFRKNNIQCEYIECSCDPNFTFDMIKNKQLPERWHVLIRIDTTQGYRLFDPIYWFLDDYIFKWTNEKLYPISQWIDYNDVNPYESKWEVISQIS